ncbi:MAG: hypothetical protein IT373_22735 [Polyangiaceae bacterium]|nr:hypothetical protein [Polyangiaceae bacterium]
MKTRWCAPRRAGWCERIVVIAGAVALAAGCSKKPESAAPAASASGASAAGGTASAPATGTPAASGSAGGSAPTTKDTGKLVFDYQPPKNPRFAPLREYVAPAEIPAVIELVNKVVALPRDVPVRTEECDQANAFYDPDRHALILCFELPEHIYKQVKALDVDDEQASKVTREAVLFSFLHELGHVMIGELELGVTGGEENVADDFATLLLIDVERPDIIESGAVAMYQLGKAGDQPKMWDEHAFGEQRFFNILCTLVGSNPETFGPRYVPAPLPVERGRRCEDEYKKKDKAWTNLLKPHAKVAL